jgi:hypothetical protein
MSTTPNFDALMKRAAPGPFTVWPEEHGNLGPGWGIGRYGLAPYARVVGDDENNLANAHLLSLAPHLGALKKALEETIEEADAYIGIGFDRSDESANLRNAITQSRSALAALEQAAKTP